MSGHSKWHNIRLRKGKQDAVRGKLFTRIAKEIIIAAQSGGGSADTNVRLRMAIQTARQNSMPSENIKRAVQRGTGELGGANLVEMVFEGYGQGGVAILVECLSDNHNRTYPDVRAIFGKGGGRMGEHGQGNIEVVVGVRAPGQAEFLAQLRQAHRALHGPEVRVGQGDIDRFQA